MRFLDPPPYLLGGERHFEIGDAERRKRIERRAHHGGRRGNRAGFAAALRTKGIVRAGLALVAFGNEERQMIGAHERVVNE